MARSPDYPYVPFAIIAARLVVSCQFVAIGPRTVLEDV